MSESSAEIGIGDELDKIAKSIASQLLAEPLPSLDERVSAFKVLLAYHAMINKLGSADPENPFESVRRRLKDAEKD